MILLIQQDVWIGLVTRQCLVHWDCQSMWTVMTGMISTCCQLALIQLHGLNRISHLHTVVPNEDVYVMATIIITTVHVSQS